MTKPRTLADWLAHAERQHPVGIDLGLARVGAAAERLGFAAPARRPAPRNVIVAGTNGKGSTCVALEALLRGAGVRVGTTLSPHLHKFNERVRIDGAAVSDGELCEAFETVDAGRGDVPLTYFEYGVLVAMVCFRRAAVDVAVLEVGLGGRLDAVNIVDADVAVITGIALDHQAYLGDDLEGIGREKAGVLRSGQRAVLGRRVTRSVADAAMRLGCLVSRVGSDVEVREHAGSWDFSGTTFAVAGIPSGALAPDNCALALEAAAALVRLDRERVRRDLKGAALPGRFERWRLGAAACPLILDVAHNPDGARFLAGRLERREPGRRFVALLGTLADKDVAGIAAAAAPAVRHWVCVDTHGPRGLRAAALCERLTDHGAVEAAAGPAEALERALALSDTADGILAFGSFSVVEQLRDLLLAGFAGARPEPPPASTGGAPMQAPMDDER